MSVRSLPVAGTVAQEMTRATVSEADEERPAELRRSACPHLPRRGESGEEMREERANILFKSRAGYIGALTKSIRNLEELMNGNGTLEDLRTKCKSYDEVWRKFVKTHEEYFECLEVLDYREEKERAQTSYEEQMARKMEFDKAIESWKGLKEKEKEKGEKFSSFFRKSSRSRATGSSVSIAVAKKREQLALAQLKSKQILREQELKHKMTELQYAKERMEAQMEEERATVSLNVYEEAEEQASMIEYRRRLDEFEPVNSNGEERLEDTDIKVNVTAVADPPVDDYSYPNPPQVEPQPVQFQSKFPSEYQEPQPVQFQPTHRTKHHSEAPVQSTPSPTEHLNHEPAQSKAPHPTVHHNFGSTQFQQMGPPESRNREYTQFQLPKQENGEAIVRALRQVVSIPKVEYMRFDGDPVKYVSFMHNFETCLEKDNPENSRRLQLLIQHCYGKAKEAIESCVNLPIDEGYYVAKDTLRENFGLPHVIAKAHITKLMNLRPLKQADGPNLLEFARHLDTAHRTLSGMGSEYIADLNHTSTLRELNKKLPMFMRVEWTECAGKIISSGLRPRFADFLQLVKNRAMLVNNEFGEDLNSSFPKDRESGKRRDERGRIPQRVTTLTAGVRSQQRDSRRMNTVRPTCVVCPGQHGVWRCDTFKNLSYQDKRKVVQERGLCIKCLCGGHYARTCPKTHFRCQKDGCDKEHNTLLHPPPARPNVSIGGQIQPNQGRMEFGTMHDASGTTVSQDGVTVTAATGAIERVCLSVVPVKVQAKGSNLLPVETYALLDSGSEVTLCHEQLQEKLGATGASLSFTLSGMTGSTKVESQLLDIVVTSMDESVSVELSNVRTVKHMPISDSCIAKRGDLRNWPHLCDIELQELDVGGVMLVVGLKEKPNLLLPLEYKTGADDEPIAVRYSLGWTVIGPIGGQGYSQDCSVNFARLVSNPVDQASDLDVDSCDRLRTRDSVTFPEQLDNETNSGRTYVEEVVSLEEETECRFQDDELSRQLERLWKTDFDNSEVETRVCASVEDKKALEVMERTLDRVDGHYQVALLWRSDPSYLPNNKVMAERRCMLLKKRLLRDEILCGRYQATMSEYIEKGHAEKIPSEELEQRYRPVWYLPHHPVSHPLKPDKVRVVYDCAAKYGGTSLNQQLLSGPDQTNQLVGVLTRFRQERVGMVADIEAMFHQVLVEPKDRDALRFLWWPDGDLSREMEEYRMVKHLFGATSSPSIANFCLRKTAELHRGEFEAETIETVKRNMYVDDMMKSTSTTGKAVALAGQLRELLARGGFRLTKWYSNDRDVLSAIPESERAKSVVNLDLERLPTESALGLRWNTEDKFVWEVSESKVLLLNQKPMTRRGIVSAVYSLFDPLGFIAPYIMKAKLLLQMLSRKRLSWDDPLGEDEKCQWKRWLDDLPRLKEVHVDRCFKPKECDDVKEVQLHLFSDASRVGYAAAAYLRLKDAREQIHCAFVMGKARLAPIREISIPRLELTAAVISVRLSKIIREELDMTIHQVYYWTDSTSVLKCINNETKRFHTFESNRLTVIHTGSTPTQWRYVNRDDNPSDDGSKGLKINAMLDDDRWLKGPTFLLKDESCWPKMIAIPVLKDDDPEVRKEAQIYTSAIKCDVMDALIERHSSWWKLKVSVAWLLRCKQYLLTKARSRKEASIPSDSPVKPSEIALMKRGHLSVSELQIAESKILRQVQKEAFPDVVGILSSVECTNVPKKALRKAGVSVYQLNPQLKEGVLRVGGRLVNAPVAYEVKHPIILPYKHHVTDLIIQHYHERLGHMGQESVLSSLRETFWIVKGRSAVRRVIRRCVDCQKRKACPGEQFMASLPEERLTPNKPPFTCVGVDYFGPLEVKQGRSHVKRYGCLFTCFTTRAVHIEIAHSLDTDSMINALRRFISVRGHPELMRSDRGTNFTKANKELSEAIEGWNHHKINSFCSQRKIEWIFNPPAASHMGGVWERMIRSVRQILQAMIKQQLVSDEVLSTVMAEVVHILNSRPLSRNSDSPLDEQPLTPNHLLHLRPSPSLPPGLFDKDDLNCTRAWRQAQYLASLFWHRWTREYLPTLLERKKWNVQKRNLTVGDLVLLADESFPRGKWPLGRVVEVVASQDGLVRTVKVKTSSTVATRAKRQRNRESIITGSTTVLTRPVAKLCLLEMEGEAETNDSV